MPGVSSTVRPRLSTTRLCRRVGLIARYSPCASHCRRVSTGEVSCRSARRISYSSRSSSLSPRRRFTARAKYRIPVAPRTRVKVEAVYQKVRRVASDHACGRRGDEDGDEASPPGAASPASGSGPLFEDITHAAHGVDQGMPEGLVDLRAEAADVDVDDVGPAVEVHVPDLFGDQRARKDVAHVPRQEREQEELLGREVQTLPGARGAVAHQVDLEIGDMELLLVASGPAPQDRAHAGEQL